MAKQLVLAGAVSDEVNKTSSSVEDLFNVMMYELDTFTELGYLAPTPYTVTQAMMNQLSRVSNAVAEYQKAVHVQHERINQMWETGATEV